MRTEETRTILLEIRNLRAMAEEHKRTCHDPECGISTGFAMITARRLVPLLDEKDRREAEHCLRDWPL